MTGLDLATGGLTNEMVCNLVSSRYKAAADNNYAIDRKAISWYNLYRCIYTGEKMPFKNVVMLPLLFSACWSDVANKTAISFGSSRIVEYDAVDPDAGPSAKRAEALTNQQFLDANILEKMIDFLMASDIYGTGILRYGYRRSIVPYRTRQSILGIEVPVDTNVVTFDGPDFEVVDMLDFKGQPGKKTIDTMAWACHRYYKDLDDLMEQSYLAQQNGAEPEFDPTALAQLKDEPPSYSIQQELVERSQVWRSQSQFEAMRQEKYARPVEMIDMIGLVPAEYARDGVRLRLMTVANRRVALRNVPTPNWDLRKHFRSYCPMPDPHYFHGTGKVEIGATMAMSGNKLVSNRLDVLDLVLSPAMFVSDATELDTQNLTLWPGRIIKVHGDTGEAQIRPLQFDLQAYPMVVNELESISRYIDMGTGVQRDTIQGMLSGDRQTAREFMGRMEQARTRLGMEAKLFERNIIEKLADDFRSMSRQFLPLPKLVSMIGSAALLDPDTGAPIPPEQQMVSLMDINASHRIRAIGASEMLSKSMQRQDYITTMQAMSTNPMGQQLTNWMAFFSKFWRAFDLNPQEMMVQTRNPMIANMLAGQGGEQGGGAGPGAPDVLSALGGGNPMLGAQPGRPISPISMMGQGMQQNRGQ